jgi:hypothetical protein
MASASKHYSTRSKISKNGSKSKTPATQSQLVLKPYHQNENDEMEEESIPGITNSQKTSIASLKLSNGEWNLVESLIYVLAPFYKATKMLSGRKYPTLALSFVIKKIFHAFLSSDTNESESDSISRLKKAILPFFEYHLESKISNEQKETVLVNL